MSDKGNLRRLLSKGSRSQAGLRRAFDGPASRRRIWAALALIAVLIGSLILPSSIFAQTDSDPASTSEPLHRGFLSVLPPIIAIGLAVLTKDVVVSLLVAVYFGALALYDFQPFTAFARAIDRFIVEAVTDPDRASILIFSGLLGAMVGVLSRSGGAAGVVEQLKDYATTRKRGQVATWMMGLAVFFDDYANTLIVGPTMRPITDRLRISREKLAYIVDSTAAPIASLIPISTWIGFEIGLVHDAFQAIELSRDAFTSIVQSIPYRFYQWFALVFGLAVAFSQRDFGAMLRAEVRAFEKGEVVGAGATPLADFGGEGLSPIEDRPHRAINAVLPILTVVGITLLGLYITGSATVTRGSSPFFIWLRDLLSAASSYQALLWASLSGVLIAIALPVSQRVLSLHQATAAAIDGLKATLIAFIVLILAWALGDVCEALGTSHYLVQMTEGSLAPQSLPLIGFVLAGAVAFATGTSWGTMGILTPLIIPLADSLATGAGHGAGSPVYESVLLGCIASVLAGSVWGDHCSPISDTTILSSMASGCDHLAHVRTQLPYAMLTGLSAGLLGFLPSAFGIGPWPGLLVGMLAVVGFLLWRGQKAETI